MSSSLSVSLIIPVYNQLQYTQQCIESIARCTEISHELIVIDNGSSDGTREFLSTLSARVITNERNLGCAKAWNQGVCAGNGELLGILNNDILVTRDWLDNLVQFMKRTGHGIVSPSAREGRLDYDLESYAAEFVKQCASATRSQTYGGCMLIRRHVFDRIGLFDEDYAYGTCEDIDFLWRAKEAGFSVGMTGSVLIHHFGMVTQDAIKHGETRAYPRANLYHFQKKWKRTVRGSWFERRWVGIKAALVENYERLRYGHTLVEKGAK